jgi:hypothetical protein
VGKEPVTADIADFGSRIAEYCREIETYLCRKNDGHLIRVTGPSFDLVAGWAMQGVPLKVACAGIDRCFERYYRKGPRRRPVKIDFCEADVLDVFDEWRRAVGISLQSPGVGPQSPSPQSPSPPSPSPQSPSPRHSLPVHLERVVLRLTEARAKGTLGPAFDALIDRAAAELEMAQSKTAGVRGEARQELIARLTALDVELLQQARALLDAPTRTALSNEVEESLAPFRAGMAPESLARARQGAFDALVRERLRLPRIAFDHE